MAGWVIRLVLLLLVLRALSRLWHGILEGMKPPRDAQPAAVPLVRDPVCGMFVVPARALTAGTGADLRFFCSEQCRRSYQNAPRAQSR
jgi:YHS domain-containing protein